MWVYQFSGAKNRTLCLLVEMDCSLQGAGNQVIKMRENTEVWAGVNRGVYSRRAGDC